MGIVDFYLHLPSNYGRNIVTAWNSRQPVSYGCFNWMIPNHYVKNGCFTKHPLKNGCLGYQVYINIPVPFPWEMVWGLFPISGHGDVFFTVDDLFQEDQLSGVNLILRSTNQGQYPQGEPKKTTGKNHGRNMDFLLTKGADRWSDVELDVQDFENYSCRYGRTGFVHEQ